MTRLWTWLQRMFGPRCPNCGTWLYPGELYCSTRCDLEWNEWDEEL